MWPNNIKYAAYDIEQFANDMVSGKLQYSRHRRLGAKSAFWKVTLTTIPLQWITANSLAVFLDSQMGSFGVFSLPNPMPSITSNNGVKLAAPAMAGDQSLILTGLLSNQPNAAIAGDFIRLTGHPKVFRVLVGCDSDSAGNGTIQITPPLLVNSAVNIDVEYGAGVNFQVSLFKKSKMDVKAKSGKLVVFDIELIEQG